MLKYGESNNNKSIDHEAYKNNANIQLKFEYLRKLEEV
jgi:hypothetical protein